MGILKQTLSYLILGQKGGQNRIQIIELLKDRPYNLNQMAEILKLNYRTIKHHVEVLMKNELLNTSHTGSYGEVYFLSPEMEGNAEIFEEVVKKFHSSNKIRDFTTSPKFFRNVMEQTTEAVIILNVDGQVFFWNESAEKLFGYTKEEIIGETVEILTDSNTYKDILDKVEKGETIVGFETKAKHKSGELKDLSITVDRIKDDKDKTIGFSILSVDISAHKHAEEALRNSEARYALAQRAANIGSWDWNISTGDLEWSETIEPMFGFESGKFGKTYEAFLNCVHPEDRQFVVDSVNACVEQGKDYDIEHRIIWPNGKIRTVSETGNVFRDETGKAIRMLGIVQDITERKDMEEELRENERRYRNLYENFPISLWEEDFIEVKRCIDNIKASGVTNFREYINGHPNIISECAKLVKIIDVNKYTLELYQAENKEQLIENLNNVFDSKSYDIFREELIAIAEGKTTFESDATNRTLKGNTINVRLRLAIAPGYEDTLSRVLVSIMEVPKSMLI
jgi:PAS domain S-box-containing protein